MDAKINGFTVCSHAVHTHKSLLIPTTYTKKKPAGKERNKPLFLHEIFKKILFSPIFVFFVFIRLSNIKNMFIFPSNFRLKLRKIVFTKLLLRGHRQTNKQTNKQNRQR